MSNYMQMPTRLWRKSRTTSGLIGLTLPASREDWPGYQLINRVEGLLATTSPVVTTASDCLPLAQTTSACAGT